MIWISDAIILMQVTELHESSKTLAEQYHHTQAGEKLGHRMLLSERKFDSDGLTHDINAMDFEVTCYKILVFCSLMHLPTLGCSGRHRETRQH